MYVLRLNEALQLRESRFILVYDHRSTLLIQNQMYVIAIGISQLLTI